MRRLFSKAGLFDIAVIAVIALIAWMVVPEIYSDIKGKQEHKERIIKEEKPIALIIEQEINWKNTINSLDKIAWTDGKSYKFDRSKSIEEQDIPDFIQLTQSEDKYPTKSCSEKYDVCGAIIRVKDANTGKIINTIKDEEMVEKGDTVFSILGPLIDEEETTTTSNRKWKDDLEDDPNITRPYTDLTYDIEIYTIKDGERVVQGTVSGETHDKWAFNIPNLMWDEKITEDIGKSIVVRSYVSVRT